MNEHKISYSSAEESNKVQYLRLNKAKIYILRIFQEKYKPTNTSAKEPNSQSMSETEALRLIAFKLSKGNSFAAELLYEILLRTRNIQPNTPPQKEDGTNQGET